MSKSRSTDTGSAQTPTGRGSPTGPSVPSVAPYVKVVGLDLDPIPDLDTSGLVEMEGHMVSLKDCMEREYERLRAEWERLLRLKAEIDAIRKRIREVCVDEKERLKLNVGGRRFEIRASTTLRNAFFRSLLSGAFVPPDLDGFFYIDRDPEFLQVILNFLRDGAVDLTRYNDLEIAMIRKEADFYMLQELVAEIDSKHVTSSRKQDVVQGTVQLNSQRPVTAAFHGVSFEINVLKKEFRVHGISVLIGVQKKIALELFYREGAMDLGTPAAGPVAWRKICDFEGQVDKGQVAPLQLPTSLSLPMGAHCFCVYSPTASNAVAVCPRKDATRQVYAFQVGHSYHIENGKGDLNRKGGMDEYDFCGDILVSHAS